MRVLAIAGSDSGGGAGIQADIKTIAAFGAYAATAITALTAQDTSGVHAIHIVPPEFVARQIAVVLDDIGADAVKTGMLGDAATIEAVAGALARHAPGVTLVVDPVMVAKGGASLLQPDAVAALTRLLLPVSTLLTPNLPEAEVLSGLVIEDVAAMHRAAAALLRLGVPAVLLKGGHLPGDQVVDLLATADGCEAFVAPRIVSRHTHGTGCTLASAIATGMAQGMTLRDAVLRARAYVRAAIAAAPGIGRGHGPLNHLIASWHEGWPGPCAPPSASGVVPHRPAGFDSRPRPGQLSGDAAAAGAAARDSRTRHAAEHGMSHASPATILLVDDDPAVRDVTAAMLEDLGYGVIEADNGAVALDLLSKGIRVDLLLADLVMPGMTGGELTAAVAAGRPGLPVLLATGDADERALAAVGEDRLVLKPFRNEELARKVRVALGGPDSGKVVSLRR